MALVRPRRSTRDELAGLDRRGLRGALPPAVHRRAWPPWINSGRVPTGPRRLRSSGPSENSGKRTVRTLFVIDASSVVELLCRSRSGRRIARLLRGATLAAPAHLDAEVLSAHVALARRLGAVLVTGDRRASQRFHPASSASRCMWSGNRLRRLPTGSDRHPFLLFDLDRIGAGPQGLRTLIAKIYGLGVRA